MAEMQANIRELRHQVGQAQAMAGAAASAALVNGRTTPPSGESTPGHAADPAASAEPTPKTPRATLSQADLMKNTDQKFEEEGVDRIWAATAEGIARGDVAGLLPTGAELARLECRSSICRGVAVYSDRKQYEESMNRALNPSDIKWPGGRAWSEPKERSDGKLEQQHFFFRQGTDALADIYREEEARLASATP